MRCGRLLVIMLVVGAAHFGLNVWLSRGGAIGAVERVLGQPADLVLGRVPITEDGERAYPLLQMANSLLWGLVVATLARVASRAWSR
jgi:phosphoenolpyruvate carboxylase